MVDHACCWNTLFCLWITFSEGQKRNCNHFVKGASYPCVEFFSYHKTEIFLLSNSLTWVLWGQAPLKATEGIIPSIVFNLLICLNTCLKILFQFTWWAKVFKTRGKKVPATYKVVNIHSQPNSAIQKHILVWVYWIVSLCVFFIILQSPISCVECSVNSCTEFITQFIIKNFTVFTAESKDPSRNNHMEMFTA